MQSNDHLRDELDDRLARNRTYGLELYCAYKTLRAQLLYWCAATLVCLAAAACLGVMAFASFGIITFGSSRIDTDFVQTYTGQTIVTTMLVLAVSAAVACFSRFTTLSFLAGEAYRVYRTNAEIMHDFGWHLDRSDKVFVS